MELSRRLGVTYNTAWKIHHKLRQVMMERDATQQLEGRVEMDDAYLGGRRPGKRGRGSAGKMPFVAAVETTKDGKPTRIKLRRVKRFQKKRVAKLTQRICKPGTTVVSDGYGPFRGIADAACTHVPVVSTGKRDVLNRTFKWVSTTLGNIKSAITGTYRKVSDKHVPRLLAEFEYRFNRRYDLAAMIPRLGWVAVRTTPMPYRLLKLTENYT